MHFGFGPLVSGFYFLFKKFMRWVKEMLMRVDYGVYGERMVADEAVAFEEMRWWIQLHVTRTLIADVPACLFFLNPLLRERF